MEDPQLAHRRSLAEVHDKGGSFRVLNPPFRFSAAAAAARPFVAALGQHSEAVLGELGYGAEDIAAPTASRVSRPGATWPQGRGARRRNPTALAQIPADTPYR